MYSELSSQIADSSPDWMTVVTPWNSSSISSLLDRLQCDDEYILFDTLGELQRVASEIVNSLFLQNKDTIISTFDDIRDEVPSPAVLTTLARISLFPHLRIACNSFFTLVTIIELYPSVFTLLPSPIFPSSFTLQQYSGLSFLAALTKKIRTVFSDFQAILPANLSHLPTFAQLTKDDPFIIADSLHFCDSSCRIPLHLLDADPPIEVDSEINRELNLFVKEALTTILTNIANIDTLIASLPSDSSPTTPFVSGVDPEMTDSLHTLRNECEDFVDKLWSVFLDLTFAITDTHKSSFQTIILDDPSFPDLILNSLKLHHADIRDNIIIIIANIVARFPSVMETIISVNFVKRMFETVDFVSLPLSESNTLFELTRTVSYMLDSSEDDEEALFRQYALLRASVFEPAKPFIIFIFHNSDKLVLDDEDQAQFESHLCDIHLHLKNMELRSDEHDADFVSELVKWEMRTMVEMENEEAFEDFFQNMLNRTHEWRRNKQERQKRREALLREEGWDDAFELRVVGIKVDTGDYLQVLATQFRAELSFNVDEF
ncbi:hypothetical protein BLNAU_6088 [Blattamonas nauphoetae]|uniref:Uncharacterized protein n=1 Tax=Blattamonas nauphoetae TaxID=2049346 RepID=A0ABQ9Y586_9EUKA|nr:hypothetical protein BLNAU_6088 [Blattamonas nauphoetae]